MSESLKGQVPALEGELVPPAGDHVLLVAEVQIGDKVRTMVGILRGMLLGAEPEVEFRCELKDALDVIEAKQLQFRRFELHHGERVVPVPGPFAVKSARLDEIMPVEQLCTLGLHLARPAR